MEIAVNNFRMPPARDHSQFFPKNLEIHGNPWTQISACSCIRLTQFNFEEH